MRGSLKVTFLQHFFAGMELSLHETVHMHVQRHVHNHMYVHNPPVESGVGEKKGNETSTNELFFL